MLGCPYSYQALSFLSLGLMFFMALITIRNYFVYLCVCFVFEGGSVFPSLECKFHKEENLVYFVLET